MDNDDDNINNNNDNDDDSNDKEEENDTAIFLTMLPVGRRSPDSTPPGKLQSLDEIISEEHHMID